MKKQRKLIVITMKKNIIVVIVMVQVHNKNILKNVSAHAIYMKIFEKKILAPIQSIWLKNKIF